MSQNNVNVVLKIYECYAKKDYDGAAALVSDSLEWTVVAFGMTVRGVEGFKQMFSGFAIPFPDSRIQVKQAIDGGDWVITEYDFVGTHNGTLSTPAGDIPATGRPIDMAGCEVWHVQNGKVTEFRTYFDAATMMQQLGVIA